MRSFERFPAWMPATALLDRAGTPARLRGLAPSELAALADELRELLLYLVGRGGGHLGAGLGVVELTIALHYVFDTPTDRLVWDVGHQAYPHKLLTGRRDTLASIRRFGGLAPFPSRDESPFDAFGVGHAGTAVSAALGMSLAARATGSGQRVCAVVGDGALTTGMTFEALAHAGDLGADVLVVLNDNGMSISPNVGALAKRLPSAPDAPVDGVAGLFETLGFDYTGPLDGHDLGALVAELARLRGLPGPRLLHVVTEKGAGYLPAASDPLRLHAHSPSRSSGGAPRYDALFGDWACAAASREPRMVAITPAMREGSGLAGFAAAWPERFFDVAIAEQHAVTLAAGMACEGLKPVVAIYSTFLQRGFDQLIHDVALQNLDVTFAVDRAGLVGEDGPTHHGATDLSWLRCVPNLMVMAPADGAECRRMLDFALDHPGPVAVRYPRGEAVPGDDDAAPLVLGRGRWLRRGGEVALLCFGAPLAEAREAAERLDASLIDMRFVKPLDRQALFEAAAGHRLLVSIEENSVLGGAGSAVAEQLCELEKSPPLLRLGLPDRFVAHGDRRKLLEICGLDAAGIEAAVRARVTWRDVEETSLRSEGDE